MQVDVRPLSRSDDRGTFSCGDAALDRYFHHYAGQNQFKFHLSVTYVALHEARIVGFATVSSAALVRDDVPDGTWRGRLPAYPLPVLRLARLGVDREAQGRGLGLALTRFVLRLAVQQRDSLGCVGVVTDAKVGVTDFYARLGFIPLASVREGRVHGLPTPMFLDMATIVAAVGNSASV